jgi:hypothetical protein
MNPPDGWHLRSNEQYLKTHRSEGDGQKSRVASFVVAASWLSLSSSAGLLATAVVAQNIAGHERRWLLAYDILSVVRTLEFVSIALGIGSLGGAFSLKMSRAMRRCIAGIVIGVSAQILIYAGLLASALGK